MNHFTEEEIKTAKAMRDTIIAEDVPELKAIYMAGEIVMWDELQSATPVGEDGLWEEVYDMVSKISWASACENEEEYKKLDLEIKSKYSITKKQ